VQKGGGEEQGVHNTQTRRPPPRI